MRELISPIAVQLHLDSILPYRPTNRSAMVTTTTEACQTIQPRVASRQLLETARKTLISMKTNYTNNVGVHNYTGNFEVSFDPLAIE